MSRQNNKGGTLVVTGDRIVKAIDIWPLVYSWYHWNEYDIRLVIRRNEIGFGLYENVFR
jgi:hypothetical protein